MICPVCGFDISNEDQEEYKKFLLSKFDEETKDKLKKLFIAVSSALPSEDIHKFNAMLYRISRQDKEAILFEIEEYLRNEMHFQGKGFLYLASMIESFGKNKEKLKEYERRKYGSPPPLKEI